MEKCILYIVAGFGIVLTPGCYSEYGVIRQHRVVYTTHIPDVYVQRPYRHRHARWRFWRPYKTPRKHLKRQHKHLHKRNVYNKTVINRHYYGNSSSKNRNHRRGKKKGKKNKNKKF